MKLDVLFRKQQKARKILKRIEGIRKNLRKLETKLDKLNESIKKVTERPAFYNEKGKGISQEEWIKKERIWVIRSIISSYTIETRFSGGQAYGYKNNKPLLFQTTVMYRMWIPYYLIQYYTRKYHAIRGHRRIKRDLWLIILFRRLLNRITRKLYGKSSRKSRLV